VSWQAIGAIAGVLGLVNAAVILPGLSFIKSMVEKTIESRLDAIRSEFDRVDERINTAGDEDQLAHLRGRVDKIEDRVDGIQQSLASEYIDRDTWVRIEGGRDISMRHLREDVGDLKESVAQLNERVSA
jgi:polyhydroxyalkanoate synthesis regulator phasin